MKLAPAQSIPERIAVLEEALAKLLDRDPTMEVGPTDVAGETAVYVYARRCGCCQGDERRGWTLGQLARELEVLLS